jgi:hypothetical protein
MPKPGAAGSRDPDAGAGGCVPGVKRHTAGERTGGAAILVAIVAILAATNAAAMVAPRGFAPADLAVRESEGSLFLYVADPSRRVLLSAEVHSQTTLGLSDLQPFTACGPFQHPAAVAVRGSRLVVLDASSAPRIVECDLGRSEWRELWKGEPPNPLLASPP